MNNINKNVSENRDKFIGGSDIPIIFNVSKFKTRNQLLLEKAGETVNEFVGNKYTEYGNTMEPKIRDYINDKFKIDFKEDCLIDNKYRCNVDGKATTFSGEDMLLEIKTCNKETFKSNEIDLVYNLQIQFYLMVYNIEKCILVKYLRTNEFNETLEKEKVKEIMIEADYQLQRDIKEEVDNFLNDLGRIKMGGLPSENNEAKEIMAKLDAVNYRLNELEPLLEERKELTNKMLQFMEITKHKKIEFSNGDSITYVEKKEPTIEIKEVFNIDKFKEERPRIYKNFLEEKEIKKSGRKAYIKINKKKEV